MSDQKPPINQKAEKPDPKKKPNLWGFLRKIVVPFVALARMIWQGGKWIWEFFAAV